ncbi:hypothetical protein BGX38DRAFT_569118 [Terfezia claveryi]|nr:hypothetical protein BGX38DRAFT_569118 [Terfezia claveryi]
MQFRALPLIHQIHLVYFILNPHPSIAFITALQSILSTYAEVPNSLRSFYTPPFWASKVASFAGYAGLFPGIVTPCSNHMLMINLEPNLASNLATLDHLTSNPECNPAILAYSVQTVSIPVFQPSVQPSVQPSSSPI